MSNDWNEKYDYLKDTRYLYHNDDYLEFLVKNVWKLNRPQNIIDFGCGFGYLGLKLLPLLPAGSSYTGIDIAVDLLAKGREIFKKSHYKYEFIEGSVYDVSKTENSYDLAICHAVMMHLEDPEKAVREMIRVTKSGGMVITCESNHNAVNALTHIQEIDKSSIFDLGFLQKLFDRSRRKTKKDGNIGNKMPVLLHQAGLINVQARLSDCVKLLLPPLDNQEKLNLYESLGKDGFASEFNDEIIAKKLKYLTEFGFSDEEAKDFIEKDRYLTEQYKTQGKSFHLTFAAAMTYSFGQVNKTEEY